jgi:3-isopropylmalate/(R)-2-methylmalate dehydratase small subunit
LTIVLPEGDVEALWEVIEKDPSAGITVDLAKKEISFAGKILTFELDDYVRWRLMEGLDDIGLTLQKMDEVGEFEAKRASFKPKTLPVLS